MSQNNDSWDDEEPKPQTKSRGDSKPEGRGATNNDSSFTKKESIKKEDKSEKPAGTREK